MCSSDLKSANAPIRMLTVTAINLVDENESEQLSIFDTGGQRRKEAESLERTVDEIRRRFGDNSIDFGNIIGNDIGIDF